MCGWIVNDFSDFADDDEVCLVEVRWRYSRLIRKCQLLVKMASSPLDLRLSVEYCRYLFAYQCLLVLAPHSAHRIHRGQLWVSAGATGFVSSGLVRWPARCVCGRERITSAPWKTERGVAPVGRFGPTGVPAAQEVRSEGGYPHGNSFGMSQGGSGCRFEDLCLSRNQRLSQHLTHCQNLFRLSPPR